MAVWIRRRFLAACKRVPILKCAADAVSVCGRLLPFPVLNLSKIHEFTEQQCRLQQCFLAATCGHFGSTDLSPFRFASRAKQILDVIFKRF